MAAIRFLPVLLVYLWCGAAAAADTRLVNMSVARQAIVLREGTALSVLAADAVDAGQRVRLVRVDADGAELEFLDLPDGPLTVRVQRGSVLGAVRAQLRQRPKMPSTIEVAVRLDPATGLPLKGPIQAGPPPAAATRPTDLPGPPDPAAPQAPRPDRPHP